MKLSELKSIVSGSALTDVLVSGFLERDQRPAQFHALQSDIFLECGQTLIRLSTIRTTARMRVTQTSSALSDIELDDDLEPAFASVREAVLEDPEGANGIRGVRLWDLKEGAEGIECSAASFELSNGQTVFFDPSYHFGLRVRGEAQEAIWLKSFPDADHTPTEIRL